MVTVDEVEILYGQDLTADERTEVEMYIGFAVGEIEAYLGRPATVQSFTETVLPDAEGACFLKNTPVVSVTALTVNDEVISDISDWITITPWGIDNLWEQTLEIPSITTEQIDRVGYYGAEVTITYTAGLDFPEALRGLVMRGVLRKFTEQSANRLRVTSGHVGFKKVQVEDYMVEYERPLASSRSSGTSSIAIFESETDFWSIKRYKRRSVAR